MRTPVSYYPHTEVEDYFPRPPWYKRRFVFIPLLVVLAALIGFAGKRTIWNTVRLELPEGFQTSEFLLQHGFVDRIVHRRDLRTEVARIIDYCEK